MNRNRVLAAAVASVLGMSVVGCQGTVEPPPFDPQKFSKGERDSAGQLATNVKPPLPTTLPVIKRPDAGWPPVNSASCVAFMVFARAACGTTACICST